MINASIPINPYVSIDAENLIINCANRRYSISVSNIKKMYLRKNAEYWVSFSEQWQPIPNKLYDLHIETNEGRNVCLTVNASERFYFIRSINHVKHLGIKTFAPKPAKEFYPEMQMAS
jgi:hypothetical protein